MANKQSSNLENLETSKIWKQSVKLAETAKHFADALPHHEQYAIANPLYQHATQVTTDIAMALGRGGRDVVFDYRYARGNLFRVKGLVLLAQQYELVAEVRHVLGDVTKLQNMLDDKIRQLESTNNNDKKPDR